MKYFNTSFILLIALLIVVYPCQVRSCGSNTCNETYCYQLSVNLDVVEPCVQVDFIDCAQPPLLAYAIYVSDSLIYANNISILSVVPAFVDTYSWKVSVFTCSISFGIPSGIPYPVDILYYLQFSATISANCLISDNWSGVITLGDNNLQYCQNYSDCNSCVGNSNCVWCYTNNSCLAGDYQKEKCDRCPNFKWGGACSGQQDDTGSAATNKKVSDAVVATVASLSVIAVAGISAGCFVLYFNPALCMKYRKKIPFLNRPKSFTTQEPSQVSHSFIGIGKSKSSISSAPPSTTATSTSPNSSRAISSTLNTSISTNTNFNMAGSGSNISNNQKFLYNNNNQHGFTPPGSSYNNSRYSNNTAVNNPFKHNQTSNNE